MTTDLLITEILKSFHQTK